MALVRTGSVAAIQLRWVTTAAALALTACASAPPPKEGAFAREQRLTTTTDERHRRIEQFVDTEALRATPRVALPKVRIDEGAYGAEITPAQAMLVANRAARSVCLGLARYVYLQSAPAEGVLEARIVVTSIGPTGGATSGISSALGFFLPVPFRVPAGLGSLALEAELRDPDAGQVALMRWARGANSVLNDAKVSPIGDAWQLADNFGDDVTKALLDFDPKKSGMQRERLSAASAKANRELCEQRYGTLRIAGRTASFALPLPPESIDRGPPPESQLLGCLPEAATTDADC
jgi:hypothetical protein